MNRKLVCKTCRGTVVATGGNTSNLFYHLKMKHAQQYYESQKMRGASTTPKLKAAPQEQKKLED